MVNPVNGGFLGKMEHRCLIGLRDGSARYSIGNICFGAIGHEADEQRHAERAAHRT
ncbi:hypothetical protein D3C81_2280600 [compost metagenome]